MAPDWQGGEAGVAEGVIPVAVRVDHRHDPAGQLPQIVAQLIGQTVVGARVDDGKASLPTDGADRLVESLVPTHPDAVADLLPGGRHAPRRTAVPDAVTMSMLPWPTVS